MEGWKYSPNARPHSVSDRSDHSRTTPSFQSSNLPFFLLALVLALLVLPCLSCKRAPRSAARPAMLTIAHDNPFLSMDPQTENDSVTWSVLGNVYDPLVEFDRDMRIVGRLAQRWENPNDYTWRFYLRKNVRFHNGKPFTSQDVVYTIERGLMPQFKGINPYLISVTGAKAIDNYTVDILTDRPNPLLLNRLSFLLILPTGNQPEKIIDQPIGSGSYVFVKRPNARTLLVKANPEYWDGKPPIENVKFVSYEPQDAVFDALLKGEVHVTRDLGENLIPQLLASKNCELVSNDTLAVIILGFNLTPGPANPSSKLHVRQAIQLGIDSGQLVKQIGGMASIAQQLVSPNVFGYDPEYAAVKADRQKAKELLAKAGYPSGFSIDMYGSDELRLKRLAEQLATIGITARQFRPTWDEFTRKTDNHEVPMYTLGWSCSTGDASDFLDALVHSANTSPGFGTKNLAAYRNAEVDRFIEQASQTLKTGERKRLLQAALARTMQDLPYIPLYARSRHYGVSKSLSWQPRRDGRLYARDMQWKDTE